MHDQKWSLWSFFTLTFPFPISFLYIFSIVFFFPIYRGRNIRSARVFKVIIHILGIHFRMRMLTPLLFRVYHFASWHNLSFGYMKKLGSMAGAGSSMIGSILLFTVVLSLQEVYRGKLASSELFTILGGFTSSLLFLFSLTVSFHSLFQTRSVLQILWSLVMNLLTFKSSYVLALPTSSALSADDLCLCDFVTCSSSEISRNLLAWRVAGVQVGFSLTQRQIIPSLLWKQLATSSVSLSAYKSFM